VCARVFFAFLDMLMQLMRAVDVSLATLNSVTNPLANVTAKSDLDAAIIALDI
jgi:hypothetical protein